MTCWVHWCSKLAQLSSAHAKCLQLWDMYKPVTAPTQSMFRQKLAMSSFGDAIDTKPNESKRKTEDVEDWYDSWLIEPMWTSDQHKVGTTAVKYWVASKSKRLSFHNCQQARRLYLPTALVMNGFSQKLGIHLSKKGVRQVPSYWLL